VVFFVNGNVFCSQGILNKAKNSHTGTNLVLKVSFCNNFIVFL